MCVLFVMPRFVWVFAVRACCRAGLTDLGLLVIFRGGVGLDLLLCPFAFIFLPALCAPTVSCVGGVDRMAYFLPLCLCGSFLAGPS